LAGWDAARFHNTIGQRIQFKAAAPASLTAKEVVTHCLWFLASMSS
jgi:hypothetical protein